MLRKNHDKNMALIHHSDLADIRKKFAGKKIVFVSGVFDLTHPGHVLFLEDSKNLGDILVAAVGDDASIKELKGGGRPLFNEHMRMKMVSAIKPVDFCFLAPAPPGQPLSYIDRVFGQLKPDIYAVNDDAFDIPARQQMADKHGVRLEVLKRTCPPEFDNVSTTKLIGKIKKQQ